MLLDRPNASTAMTIQGPSRRTRPGLPIDLTIALVTLAAPYFLFSVGSDFRDDPLVKQLWNLGHVCVYFIWTWYLTYRLEALMRMRLALRLSILMGLALGTGLVIEMLQLGIGRSADGWDVARNLLGCFLALWWTAPNASSLKPVVRRGGRLLSALLLLLALHPFFLATADRVHARHRFPVLSDFETPWELERWTGQARFERSSAVSLSGSHSLKVMLGTTHYSGVMLQTYPRDWRGYEILTIGVYNPEPATIAMTCRIHDLRHAQGSRVYGDRFNRSYALNSGWNDVTIPLGEVQSAPEGRSMEMGNIMALGLFAVRLDRPRVVYLDHIRLQP